MSDEDIRMVEERENRLAWESERGQAVTLLRDAAHRIEQTAACATPGDWVVLDGGWALVAQPDREDRSTWRTVVSEPGERNGAWMVMTGPRLAPFLAGWLRSVAGVLALQAERGDFTTYIDRDALGLAQHVMNHATTEPTGE